MAIVVTDDTTREQLAATLAYLNADAKAISRRGYIGTHDNPEYVQRHELMDAVLTDLLARQT